MSDTPQLLLAHHLKPILDSRGRISAVSVVQAVDLLEGTCGCDFWRDAKFCGSNAAVS
jgi:hypothetical protein